MLNYMKWIGFPHNVSKPKIKQKSKNRIFSSEEIKKIILATELIQFEYS